MGTSSTETRPLRVLITGYGPFSGIRHNPAETIARQLGKLKLEGVELTTKILPVEWPNVDLFMRDELPVIKPDLVISLGYAQGRHEIKDWATNFRQGVDEGDRYCPGTPIV